MYSNRVRSFDNQVREVIAFHTPLTLIVGYNGSGKTTIIECLKYATTGDLPPNSRGGAFIHDPQLAGEKEVMAQVKLAFNGTSGVELVVTRSLQLTVKKTARVQKTLEGSLNIRKDGERSVISTRVAELDQIMPQYLGVSKAVLDSVIFCHQDESLWPMSEPAALKKRFDEIFEALKYTKAIDNIKKLRKTQNEELAKYKIMEQHSKEDKEKADRAEKQSRKLQKEIQELREETTRLGEEVQQANETWHKAARESATYEKVLGTLDGKRIEAQAKEDTIRDLKAHLNEMHESDDWLQSTLDQYEERLGQYQEQEQEQRQQYGELEGKIEASRKQLGAKQAEKGKFENEKTQFERRVARRKTVIKDTARRHKIRGFDDPLDDEQIDEFMHKVRKMSKDQNLALEKARREAQEEVRKAQAVLDQLEQRKKMLQANKVDARKQMQSNDREAQTYQKKLDSISVDEGSKATLEAKIEDVERRLRKAKTDSEAASWDKKLQEANTELRNYEDESSRLNSELIQGTKRAGDLARLDHLKKELKDRQRSLETMKGAHGSRISKIVTEEWDPATLEQDYRGVMEGKSRELVGAEKDRDGVSREQEQVEFRLKTVRNDLKRKQTESKECGQRIRAAIEDEPSEFPYTLQQKEIQLEEGRSQVTENRGMMDYFMKCVEAANIKKVCRTCTRVFKEKELDTFIKKYEGVIAKANKEEEDRALKELEDELKVVRDLSADYDTWQRLSTNEIPSLEKEAARLEAQRDELTAKLERHDLVVSERQESRNDTESLGRTVTTIARYQTEITSFEGQIKELSAKQQISGLARTLEDIQEELATTGEKARAVKLTISKLTGSKDLSTTEINRLEIESRDVKGDLANAVHQLENRASLVARVDEYKNLNQRQREAIDTADKEIEKLAPEISTAQIKFDDVKQRGESLLGGLQQDATQLSDSVHQLDLASEEIKAYEDRGSANHLARSDREIKNCESEIMRLREEQRQLTMSIKKIQDEITNSDNSKRSINDNIRYRRDKKALEIVLQEIRTLEERHADVDIERIQAEVHRFTKKHERLSAERAGKFGEMKSKDNQLLQLIADWNTDYKDAALKFKENHIKVETTKAAVEDLGRYGGALDKAIMKYHSIKMEEINRIIEELWQKTYKGTDVDTILIRSDNENAKGNRSYNYRVCMVKSEVEMDMRGRCSAGQKVLASIIIRLALAECFGVSCGIIALDEPTTNLDKDNIRSLAQSLHDIILIRRKQSNFQLIVITHDEEFLKYMQCGDFADYYYRVSRNHHQKSVIERQEIAQVC